MIGLPAADLAREECAAGSRADAPVVLRLRAEGVGRVGDAGARPSALLLAEVQATIDERANVELRGPGVGSSAQIGSMSGNGEWVFGGPVEGVLHVWHAERHRLKRDAVDHGSPTVNC